MNRPGRQIRLGIGLLLSATVLLTVVAAGESPAREAGLGAAGFFQTTSVWDAHLGFTPEQWKALEPKRTGGGRPPFFGGPPRGDGSGQRAGGPGFGGPMQLRNPEARRNGLAGMLGLDFDWVHGSIAIAGSSFPEVAVRYKGNGTYMQSQRGDKRPFKVDFDKYARGQNLAGITKLNFANNIADPSYLNDALSEELFRAAGVPAPRTTFARVFLTVPGERDNTYLGLYTVIEYVDSVFAQDRFGTKGGAIFKPVTPTLFEYLGEDWTNYAGIYDGKTKVHWEQQRRVIELCRLVSQATDEEFRARAGEFLDVEEFARFMAVTVFLSTYDSLLAQGQNFYLYLHPATRKFLFIPWDLDHSFGEFPMIGSAEQRVDASIMHPWVGENRFLERVFAWEEFRRPYRARLREFLNTIFEPAGLNRRIDAVAAAVRPAIREESPERLARFELTLGETPPAQDAAPEFFRFGRFGAPPNPMKVFVSRRVRSIADQLAGKSEGSMVQRGGFGFGGHGGPRPRGGGPGGFGPPGRGPGEPGPP